MRRYLLTLTAVLVLLAGCGGEGDEAVDSTDAEARQFIVEDSKQLFLGQHGRRYDTLHPAQQALVDRATFVECLGREAGAGGEVDVTVLESYETTETIPGTDIEADGLAVTVTISAQGQEGSTTRHAFQVGGQWRWAMSGDLLSTCTA